ncbi:MAG TPA: histidine kinase, partial [Syntrophobacteraceae bacterium]|nr:histidine kinase [Syntrophobacteraceae bacterium]
NSWGFCQTEGFSQCVTNQPGILVGGSFSGLRDISESVIQASSAACSASRLIHAKGGGLGTMPAAEETPAAMFRDVTREPPRVVVALCQCGDALTTALDQERLAAAVNLWGGSRQVVFVDQMCTREGWEDLIQALRSAGANRVLIGACVPYVFGRKLRELGQALQLNPALIEVVDVRSMMVGGDEVSSDAIQRDVTARLAMAVGRLRGMEPMLPATVPVIQRALVVGGGIAGMTAALAIADHGFEVDLVEQSADLGGNLRGIYRTLSGDSPQELLEKTITRVEKHPKVRVFKGTRVMASTGRPGRFMTTL